jgi:hypothetical protein
MGLSFLRIAISKYTLPLGGPTLEAHKLTLLQENEK